MIINAMLTYLHISIPTYLSGNAIPGRRSGKYHWYTMTSRHGKTSMRMSSRSFDKAGGQVSRLHHCMYRDLFSHYIHTYSHDPIVSTLSTQRLQFSGCLDAANSNILEAPLYNNRQIEDAWLFLLEMRRRHKNRGKHVQECARVLGASYNWSIVLQGSKKVLEALNDLPQEVCTEILEGADAHELLRSIYPQRRPRRDDWMNTPSSLPANGWSDSDPSWMGKDTPNGAGTRDAWPDAAWPDAGRTKNPFKAEGVATEWPDPPAQVPQTPGWGEGKVGEYCKLAIYMV